jgi:hypothetical protein
LAQAENSKAPRAEEESKQVGSALFCQEALRPFARGMHHCQDTNFLANKVVSDNVGETSDDKLAGSIYPAFPAKEGKSCEVLYLSLYHLVNAPGRIGIVLTNIGDNGS